MRQFFTAATLAAFSATVLGQSFTTSGITGSGVTAAGVSVSAIAQFTSQTVSGSATYTLQPAGSGFDRYDVRIAQTRTIGNPPFHGFIPPSAFTSVAGVVTNSTTLGENISTSATSARQAGYSVVLGASATSGELAGDASASTLISVSQARQATKKDLGRSVAAAGSATVTGSTSSLWIFDFPGDPATGTATINLGDATATFKRSPNSLGETSGHRDNVRLEVKTFLDGVQVGFTAISAVNTSLAPGVGAANQDIVFSSVPSVTLNPADVYGTTKSLTVVTTLIGTAYFGNSTMLGDYEIASSTFSGVQVQGVPEPASIAGLSLGLLAFARRRKSK
ncbi:MAG: PEP-CTERM sorting domain-containing protein [Fimbriimonas sp.]|nr:PEP-CTERM sorting domain-containing protein [Fimbriimonas sp.]